MKLNTLIPIWNPTKKLCCGGTFAKGGEVEALYKKVQDSSGDMVKRVEAASNLWDAWSPIQKRNFLREQVFPDWNNYNVSDLECVMESDFSSLPSNIQKKALSG